MLLCVSDKPGGRTGLGFVKEVGLVALDREEDVIGGEDAETGVWCAVGDWKATWAGTKRVPLTCQVS